MMRKLALLVALLVWPACSWAAMALDYDFGSVNSGSFGSPPFTISLTSKTGGCASGDLVVIQYVLVTNSGCATAVFDGTLSGGSGTWSNPTPSGCTNPVFLASPASSSQSLQIKTAAASEPNSYTLTVSADPTGCSGSMNITAEYRVSCFSGSATSFDQFACSNYNAGSTTSATIQTPALSITTTAADYVLASYWVRTTADWHPGTVPSGYTNTYNAYDTPNGFNYQGDYLLQGAAGTTAPQTVYSNATAQGVRGYEFIFGVSPSAGPPPGVAGFFLPGLP